MYTKQSAFNKVWDHFIVKNGERAVMRGSCVYKTNEGDRCAFGVLIPDDAPTEIWNIIGSIDAVYMALPQYVSTLIDIKDMQFYLDLQKCHDSFPYFTASFKYYMRYKLSNLAERYQLILPDKSYSPQCKILDILYFGKRNLYSLLAALELNEQNYNFWPGVITDMCSAGYIKRDKDVYMMTVEGEELFNTF